MGISTDFLNNILTHGPSQGAIRAVLTELKQQGRTQEVIQECIKALAIYPDDIFLRKLLAESYMEVGYIGLAEAEISRVTSDLDGLSIVYKLQARILARQKRYHESCEALKRYLSIHPDDEDALNLMGQVTPVQTRLQAQEATAAEVTRSDFESSLVPAEAEPEPEPPGEVQSETREQQASGPGSEADMEETIVDLATPTLAELYFSQGQIQDAIATYEKVLQNQPHDVTSYNRLAEIRMSTQGQAKTAAHAREQRLQGKTENTISILENWRARIKSRSNV